jgi:hypothetical protein
MQDIFLSLREKLLYASPVWPARRALGPGEVQSTVGCDEMTASS